MQLHHLHAFLALAQDLNFRRAAARLYISQPAQSAQVAELERLLCVQLFQRDRSGTRLTADGLALVPVARSAVAAMAEVELAGTKLACSAAATRDRSASSSSRTRSARARSVMSRRTTSAPAGRPSRSASGSRLTSKVRTLSP
jgi:DNA-binding transcriptional LysR family regulator